MNLRKEIQHIYLVGAKSLGAYGGYETFVYKLTEYHQNKENIKYHVACKANGDGCMDESKFEGVTKINDHEFELHNAHCFKIDVPQIGSAQAIYYDVAALKACCEHGRSFLEIADGRNITRYAESAKGAASRASVPLLSYGVMSNVRFDELELILMAMFEQPTLRDTIQVLTEAQPLVAEDAEMAVLVQQTIQKMQQLNEQQFKGLELEWHRPEEPEKEKT